MENSTNQKIAINCKNDGLTHTVEFGTMLSEISKEWCQTVMDRKTGETFPVIAALVDHKLKELEYMLTGPKEVEFIGYNHPDGRRCYIRSLIFVLQKVIRDLYPDKVLLVDHSLPSGYYCELAETEKSENGQRRTYFLKDEEIETIKEMMQALIDQDLPFHKKKCMADDAADIFSKDNQPDKVALLRSTGRSTINVYSLGDTRDTFYGPLIPSTGYLKVFDIFGFSNGICLQLPQIGNFNKVMPMKRQSKIAATLEEYQDWCEVLGIYGIGDLNRAISEGKAIKLINISEALQERKYAEIADRIWERRGEAKIIFIAGPSSSGKTSSSLRLAYQCKVLGMNPKVIELDNYFVNRDKTPKDEDGNFDFESLYAMDLDFLNDQLNELLEGKEVEIPKYDFKTGTRTFAGNRMRLEAKDILIMEGIHALNPEMTSAVDNSRIFRLYVSALTSLNVDENNSISTSDNRLLRRMVRDNRTRGINPEGTILRWHSVRSGEARNIFPFQENADAIFNSAMIFELPMLKYFAEPLLERIPATSDAYTEAVRLMKFLGYINALQPSEIDAIPPTSIMREFIGGQTLSL